MSKKNRALKKAHAVAGSGARTTDGRPIARLKGPADVLAIVPYLLGFRPSNSLVLVSLRGPHKRFGPIFRADLLGGSDDAVQIEHLLTLVQRHRFERVLVAALTADKVAADAVVLPLLEGLAGVGVEVDEAVVANGERWWSYLCHNEDCCSPEGTPYDVKSSAAAAQAVFEGLAVAPDRESLRAQFGPVPGRRRGEVSAAASRLEAVDGASDETDVVGLVRRSLRDPGGLSAADVAGLALAVRHPDQRDRAWLMMTRANAEAHLDLWRTVMQQVPDRLLAPVGSLAAFAAWVTGRGVLASHALERVHSVDPDYSMARLLAGVLVEALNPAEWDLLRSRLVSGGGGDPS